MQRGLFLTLLTLFVCAPFGPLAVAGKTIPPVPQFYVLDEAKLLTEQGIMALQMLLVEHDRLTGEQLALGIFNAEGDEHEQFTREIFFAWGIGKRENNKGALIALFSNDKEAMIEVGFGLESVFPEEKSSRLAKLFTAALKSEDPNREILLTTVQLLETLESPLIANGQANRILKQIAPRVSKAKVHHFSWAPSLVFVAVGLLLITAVLYVYTSAEAHYTSGGWFRPRPWHTTSLSDTWSHMVRGKRPTFEGGGSRGSW